MCNGPSVGPSKVNHNPYICTLLGFFFNTQLSIVKMLQLIILLGLAFLSSFICPSRGRRRKKEEEGNGSLM